MADLADKTILITGGSGSIGTELTKQLLPFEPRQIRIYSRTEWRQLEFGEAIGNHPLVRRYIGDIRNRDRLQMAMVGSDIVFHLAAMRHIDYCDWNVSDAVAINAVPGTTNVVDLAAICQVRQVILASTAEAVEPTNVYGASKLEAERLFYRAHQEHPDTAFKAVRFGNVLGGKGSLIPLIAIKMLGGNPITLYHQDMARRVMTIPHAARQLVATLDAPKAAIVLSSLPLAYVRDIIAVTAELLHLEPEVVMGTPRAGEKLVNRLYSDAEADLLERFGDYYILNRLNSPVECTKWLDTKEMNRVDLTQLLKGVLNDCATKGALTGIREV